MMFSSRLVLTLGVIAITLVASFGFQYLSENPLEPEATIEIRDAPTNLSEEVAGVTPMLEFHHVRGEPIPVAGIEIILGPRVQGVVFNRDNDWTPELTGIQVRVFLNGRPLATGQRFEPGQTIVMARTTGEFAPGSPEPARVRVFYTPSESLIAEATVTIR